MLDSPSRAFWAGVQSGAPLIPGVIAFSTVVGVAATQVGMPPVPAFLLSAFSFAGTAQIAAYELMGRGAPAWVVVLTAFVINARYLMYSASIAPYFKQLSLLWKTAMGFLLVDQTYAIAIIQFRDQARFPSGNQQDERGTQQWFLLGMGLTVWIPWIGAAAVGILLGVQTPPEWSLTFVVPLVFVAILVPVLRDSPSIAAAFVAGTVALWALELPLNLGMLVASGSGIMTGLLVETWQEKHRASILRSE